MKFREYDNYEIYEDGRIFSYLTNKFLKPQTTKNGYQQVTLIDNYGKRKKYLLHRVVYETFTSKPIPEGMQCNHISEDKTDNRFWNINIMTPKENTRWGTGIERQTKARINGKCSKSVGAFKNGELVLSFPSTKEAQRQGFNHGAVAACCRNCYSRHRNNVYKGYTWKYI